MNYKKLQAQAYRKIISGHYEESVKDYEVCINLNPDDLINYLYLGLLYFLQGEELEAQAIWISVLLQETSEKTGLLIKNLLHILETELIRQIKLKNLELAKRLEIQIEEIDSRYRVEQLEQQAQAAIEKLLKEANQFKKKGKYQEAEATYQQLLFWNHENADIWNQLGLLYYQVVEYSKALDCIMNAINLKPLTGNYHYNVGLILEKLKQIPQAIKAYYQAIELDPSLVKAYHQLSHLLHSVGELEEAENIIRRIRQKLSSHL